jgi:hypothetical protein
MYKVCYYSSSLETSLLFKEFETWELALEFVCTLPVDSLLEMKYYESSSDNGSTLWSKE